MGVEGARSARFFYLVIGWMYTKPARSVACSLYISHKSSLIPHGGNNSFIEPYPAFFLKLCTILLAGAMYVGAERVNTEQHLNKQHI
jgi:hypothetical protein